MNSNVYHQCPQPLRIGLRSMCNCVQTRQLLYYIGIKTFNAQRLLRPCFTKPNQSI